MKSVIALALLSIVLPVFAAAPTERNIGFTYTIPPADFPSEEAVDIYIPLPTDSAGQKVVTQVLQSSVPGTIGHDTVHGNRYLHLHRPAGSSEPLSASLYWTVDRSFIATHGPRTLPESARQESLAPDTLVPVDHEILAPILEEVHALRKDDTPESTARAIYDWVVDNVEYKKVGTGWGNGDTFWACNERYGNCTDFHALLISLARTEGIPARFEIGFPIPTDRDSGEIKGYHCWVQLYLPGQGWIPIDASEAAKHPEQRELLYGGQPADRIFFTVGRDLVVSKASAQQPLNYFIYPYVEVGGKPWEGKVPVIFSFEDLSDAVDQGQALRKGHGEPMPLPG